MESRAPRRPARVGPLLWTWKRRRLIGIAGGVLAATLLTMPVMLLGGIHIDNRLGGDYARGIFGLVANVYRPVLELLDGAPRPVERSVEIYAGWFSFSPVEWFFTRHVARDSFWRLTREPVDNPQLPGE